MISPTQAQPSRNRRPWGRALLIGLLVVLVGYVFLHFEPRIRRPTCRNLLSYATGPDGNRTVTFAYVCLSVYFYYLAAFVGSGAAAIVALRRITALRALLFIVLCDVFVTWLAGIVVLVWDRLQPHTLPGSEAFWFLLLPFGLLLGIVFGNVATFSFPLWSGAAALLITIGAEAAYGRLRTTSSAR